MKEIPGLEENLSTIISRLKILVDSMQGLDGENLEDKIKKYDDLKERLGRIDLDISRKFIERDRIKFDIESAEDRCKSLEDDLVILERNVVDSDSDDKIDALKSRIVDITDSIRSLDSERMMLAEKKGTVVSLIGNLRDEKSKYSSLRGKWKIYESIMSAVSKKGVPLQIIRSQLPVINGEISKILAGVVDFTVFLDVDVDSNSMDVFIDYGDSRRIIELGSGMEKMISSLAIRVALLNVSSLPKTDMLIIDEGFGALDDNYIESCSQLLTSLKRWFKNILIITHVDSIKDIADNVFEISKHGKDSKIVYG